MKREKKKWYKSFGSWLIIIGCIILVPILIANIYIIFQSKTNKNKVPSVFGYKPFIVLSGSMEGQIHKGDLILTKEVDPTTLKIKDIIAFRDAENTVTTHRIIDIVENNGKTQFITKGDNNSTQDRNLVSLEDVEGIYVGRISSFGSMMSKLSEPTTILALALIITVIFVMGFAISIKNEKKLEREEFLKFKMMKEEQYQNRVPENDELSRLRAMREQSENEELLELRRMKEEREKQELLELKRLKEKQEQEELELRILRELQARGYSKEEILELLRARREKQERDSKKY